MYLPQTALDKNLNLTADNPELPNHEIARIADTAKKSKLKN